MKEMARKKKESTPGEKLAKQIIEQYNPQSVADRVCQEKCVSFLKVR